MFIRTQVPGEELVTYVKASRILSIEGDNDGSSIVVETKTENIAIDIPYHPDRVMAALAKAEGSPFFHKDAHVNVTETDEPEPEDSFLIVPPAPPGVVIDQ